MGNLLDKYGEAPSTYKPKMDRAVSLGGREGRGQSAARLPRRVRGFPAAWPLGAEGRSSGLGAAGLPERQRVARLIGDRDALAARELVRLQCGNPPADPSAVFAADVPPEAEGCAGGTQERRLGQLHLQAERPEAGPAGGERCVPHQLHLDPPEAHAADRHGRRTEELLEEGAGGEEAPPGHRHAHVPEGEPLRGVEQAGQRRRRVERDRIPVGVPQLHLHPEGGALIGDGLHPRLAEAGGEALELRDGRDEEAELQGLRRERPVGRLVKGLDAELGAPSGAGDRQPHGRRVGPLRVLCVLEDVPVDAVRPRRV
mmetsp:Transcript_21442/g.51141  ORF Transcript_21442/g.51141 Transcript_21442/m.51141 type:complete len:314 (-) Transcript_21442:947-1888(-)